MTYTLQLETPVGPVTITATGEAVTQIRFGTEIFFKKGRRHGGKR